MRKNIDILAIALITASILVGQTTVERLTSPPLQLFLASSQTTPACPIQAVIRSHRDGLRSRINQLLQPVRRSSRL